MTLGGDRSDAGSHSSDRVRMGLKGSDGVVVLIREVGTGELTTLTGRR